MNSELVIIEIRAGTGGNEAALFVGDLFEMYSSYAESKGFKVKTISSNSTPLGGFKEIIFEISGQNVYQIFQHEGGVHRVQRIPKTEKSDRIHTSTASVAILKKGSSQEVTWDLKDLRVDYFRSSGPGGQNVNKRETAVRITHLPSGAVVESQKERSQAANKEYAMNELKNRIGSHLKEKEIKEEQGERREQIGSADRSEKIRTYNFPQNRITDHRIKKSWHNLDKIMRGNLDVVFKKLSELDKKEE